MVVVVVVVCGWCGRGGVRGGGGSGADGGGDGEAANGKQEGDDAASHTPGGNNELDDDDDDGNDDINGEGGSEGSRRGSDGSGSGGSGAGAGAGAGGVIRRDSSLLLRGIEGLPRRSRAEFELERADEETYSGHVVVAGQPRHLALYDRSVAQVDRRMVEPVAQSAALCVGRWRQINRPVIGRAPNRSALRINIPITVAKRSPNPRRGLAPPRLWRLALGTEVALAPGLVRLAGPENVDQLGALRLADAGPGAPRDRGSAIGVCAGAP